jgi:hypothetical protein
MQNKYPYPKGYQKPNWFIVILPIIGCIIALVQGCTQPAPVVEPPSKPLKQIKVIEEGVLDGYSYKMFLDPKTGQRILYYRDAMVVLPTEKPELQ